MIILSTAVATVLFASCTLATPTSLSSHDDKQPEKRAFRAEAHRYIPNQKRSTGVVNAKFDGGGWILPVTIGGEKVILNIDTGSSDLWTASTLMPDKQQKTVTSGFIFDPTKSKSFKYMKGSTYDIAYADGSGSSGSVGIDSVNIGGAIVPNMPFGVCKDLRYGGDGTGTRDTDGPVGLGFGQENSIRPNPQCTFMECLEPHVPKPVFSTKFRPDNSGFVDFGKIDSTAYTGKVTQIKINNSTGQWIANDVKFGSGGKVFNADAIQMDFDTGTASLAIPPAAAKAYFALVKGSSQDSTGAYTYPCGNDLPSFDYVFSHVDSGPSTVSIPGNNLKDSGNPGNNGKTCYTWIGTTTGGGNAGYPFYISKYMMFNQKVPNLSFATQS